MNQETKIMIGIAVATIVIIVGAVLVLGKSTSQSGSDTSKVDPKLLIRNNSQTLGNPKAKIQLVEFGDYQCPACGAAYPITKTVLAAHGKDIYFIFRNFPLTSIHKNAELAAEAAETAGKYGKFWQMHDTLYENQDKWGDSDNALSFFADYAKTMGIPQADFIKNVKDSIFAQKIGQDISDGNALGVNATPTFYINGEKIDDFNNLQAEVEQRLKE